MNQLPRRALSRYGLTFQGNILSVNCQCRMLTRVRRTHSTSPVENSLITNPQEGEIHFKKGGHQPAMKTDAAKGANQHEVLRKMNSTKRNEMASLIEIAIDFND